MDSLCVAVLEFDGKACPSTLEEVGALHKVQATKVQEKVPLGSSQLLVTKYVYGSLMGDFLIALSVPNASSDVVVLHATLNGQHKKLLAMLATRPAFLTKSFIAEAFAVNESVHSIAFDVLEGCPFTYASEREATWIPSFGVDPPQRHASVNASILCLQRIVIEFVPRDTLEAHKQLFDD
jgi:hypothetical protein